MVDKDEKYFAVIIRKPRDLLGWKGEKKGRIKNISPLRFYRFCMVANGVPIWKAAKGKTP